MAFERAAREACMAERMIIGLRAFMMKMMIWDYQKIKDMLVLDLVGVRFYEVAWKVVKRKKCSQCEPNSASIYVESRADHERGMLLPLFFSSSWDRISD